MTATDPISRAPRISPSAAVPDLDEAELIARVRAGDPRGEELLVREYSPRMLAIARRMLRCEEDAADALQEAFISAFRSIDSFAGDSRLSTWLCRIVMNACLMKLRRNRSRPTVSIDELLPCFDDTGHHAARVGRWSDDAHEKLASAETRSQVRECINRLPKPYKEVLMLRDIEGLDTAETAGLLGETTSNIKTRLHRARQALRTLLDPMFK